MIRVIDEYVVIRFAVYHLFTPSSDSTFIAQEDGKEVFSSDLITCVILQWMWSWSLGASANPYVITKQNHIVISIVDYSCTCAKLRLKWRNIKYYLWNTIINIFAFRMINDNPRPRVQNVMGNIIIHEHHNVLLFYASFSQYLVRMAYISLQ